MISKLLHLSVNLLAHKLLSNQSTIQNYMTAPYNTFNYCSFIDIWLNIFLSDNLISDLQILVKANCVITQYDWRKITIRSVDKALEWMLIDEGKMFKILADIDFEHKIFKFLKWQIIW